jgi:RND family efflux transporter MFP subunit
MMNRYKRVQCAAMLLPLLWILFLSGCSRTNSSTPAPAPAAVVAVQALQVEASSVQRTVEFVGTLEGEREVTVSSEVAGRVLTIKADLGDRVQPGQVLAEIDSRELVLAVERQQAALQQTLASLGLSKEGDPMPDPASTSVVRRAAADLADARVNYERAQSLVAKNVVAKQVYDSAEARYKGAEANYTSALEGVRNLIAQVENLRVQLALARKKVADASVRAPFGGTIRARMVEMGQYVKEQGSIVSITDTNPLKMRAGIPEQWFPYVTVGARIEFRVEAYPEKFPGRVSRISRSIDPQSRTFAIEAEVDNTAERLRPGLFARAELLTSRTESVLRVPASAVISYYGVQKIYAIENSQIVEKVVKLGDRFGDVIEVTEGLTSGAWIATTQLTKIQQGSRVEVRKES